MDPPHINLTACSLPRSFSVGSQLQETHIAWIWTRFLQCLFRSIQPPNTTGGGVKVTVLKLDIDLKRCQLSTERHFMISAAWMGSDVDKTLKHTWKHLIRNSVSSGLYFYTWSFQSMRGLKTDRCLWVCWFYSSNVLSDKCQQMLCASPRTYKHMAPLRDVHFDEY